MAAESCHSCTAVEVSDGGEIEGMQVHSWRSQLQVTAIVQVGDRKQPDLGIKAAVGNLVYSLKAARSLSQYSNGSKSQ